MWNTGTEASDMIVCKFIPSIMTANNGKLTIIIANISYTNSKKGLLVIEILVNN